MFSNKRKQWVKETKAMTYNEKVVFCWYQLRKEWLTEEETVKLNACIADIAADYGLTIAETETEIKNRSVEYIHKMTFAY